MALSSGSVASKPIKVTLPERPAVCKARSMPNVVGALGVKIPSTAENLFNRFCAVLSADSAVTPAY